jgi:hypothetical protein
MSYDHRRASDRDEFRETFARNQGTAAREMEAVIATIREVDPGAVALVFGDHGLLLSLNLGSESYLEDPEFYVLDHLAIRMAIWPADACRRELDDVAGLGFITVAMAMRAIVTCLSDGVDPVDKSVTYSVPFWTRDRYERYLYERAPKGRAASP